MGEMVTKGNAGINAGVTFDIRMDPPLKEFQFRVSRFTKGISDWSSCLRAFGELFKRQMGEQFETEGAISGGRWQVLKDTYKAWKEVHYPGNKIGVLTGALRSAMTGGGGYSEHITMTTGDYGMSDTSSAAPYGGYFTEKRPVIRMTARQGTSYQKVAHQWLIAEARGLTGAGAGIAGDVRMGGGGVGGISSALAESL
jgi:hypothetical protein